MPVDTESSPKYACLSHCWGRTRSRHNTHTENLAANKVGIPLSELPKTFQDAIEIARRLDLHFLWIDFLCIVEDSPSGWEIHVEAMAFIYENAHTTLAAGASADDDGGFFADAHDRVLKSNRLELKSGPQVYSLYFRHSVAHPDAGWPTRDLVAQYSSRNLTFPQDKLPALAGLAKAFQRKFQMGHYAHGVWMSSAQRQLAWASRVKKMPFHRPRCGPSWSWAYSSDGQIEWKKLMYRDYYALLTSGDSTSNETEPLLLSGLLLTISVQMLRYTEQGTCYVIGHKHQTPLSNAHLTKKNDSSGPDIKLVGEFSADYKFWASEKDLQLKLQHVTFAILGMGAEDGLNKGAWVAGLILRPAHDPAVGKDGVERYERFGWLRYWTEQSSDGFESEGTRTKFLLV
ncbi:hypothetical protein CC86DRAFT_349226 [Ophiobolus disseminans]|uniref:Heterokaryon incompatibility domain-containing protein n=1 Tax=Ophiobolus disseminans TaxID=1469910 RepID=A0A6A7A4E0_9PLEO|nr:hypothetical protein CC86DRAFT_349226 [Ophiobolus disseminans]